MYEVRYQHVDTATFPFKVDISQAMPFLRGSKAEALDLAYQFIDAGAHTIEIRGPGGFRMNRAQVIDYWRHRKPVA